MAEMPYNDKERIMDLLSSQKFITDSYNTNLNEAATPEVKTCMMNILNEEHEIQHDIWLEMKNRGWYTVEAAEDQKLQQEKQKFSSVVG